MRTREEGLNKMSSMHRVPGRARVGGFSLIEIMVVLVILGLLISIVAPNVLNRADEARVAKAFADFKSIETALQIYRLDNFSYPTTEQGLEGLVSPSSIDPEPRNFQIGRAHV